MLVHTNGGIHTHTHLVNENILRFQIAVEYLMVVTEVETFQ